jgi:YidC/Oxa1 family membrane protein insertase
MMALYEAVAYDPIYNSLILFYNIIPWKDFGIAIILTTLLIRFLIYPVTKKQISSQKKLQELQPKLKELQQKHKDNKEEQAKKMMELYKEHGVNPLSGCLPIIVYLIVFIAIYQAIIHIAQTNFSADAAHLYTFVQNPGPINHLFLGTLDLTKPNILLAIITAIAQYFQMKMMLGRMPTPALTQGKGDMADFANIMNKQMLYIAPAATLFIGATFPAALSIYWLTSTLFMLAQQRLTFKEEAVK